MKDKKIVIVSLGLSLGGTEKESVSIANFLNQTGYSVKYIAAYQSEHFFSLSEGIEFVEPKFIRKKLNAIVYLLKLIIFLRREIKLFNPSNVLSFNEWINPFVVLANYGLKNNIHLRDVMNPRARYPILIKVARNIFYPRASSILVQTNYAKDILNQEIKVNHIEVIPTKVQFVDVKKYETKNRIITIGRLEKVKGHKFLLEAFSNLNAKDWELHIVGEGSLLGELVELSKALKIDSRVCFHGKVQDFSEILANCSIFVLPSLREGFPNALIEAMSVPLACISSDYYEGREEIIINGENGFVFPVGDTDVLTGLLTSLIDSKELRDRIAMNAYNVRTTYATELINQKYLNIIKNEN